jgi:hypothetical protein
MKFLHVGIPTEHKNLNKSYAYVEKIKLHVTNPNDHELKLQFVWVEPDSPLPDIVKKERHISIQVDDIEEAVKQFDYIAFPPISLSDTLKISFAVREGVLFELMQMEV